MSEIPFFVWGTQLAALIFGHFLSRLVLFFGSWKWRHLEGGGPNPTQLARAQSDSRSSRCMRNPKSKIMYTVVSFWGRFPRAPRRSIFCGSGQQPPCIMFWRCDARDIMYNLLRAWPTRHQVRENVSIVIEWSGRNVRRKITTILWRFLS